jgi:ABC-type uncharacterized transport system fused permease/ATPase subunit
MLILTSDKVILIDEVLDTLSEKMLNTVMKYIKESNKTFIITSHRASIISQFPSHLKILNQQLV